MPGVLQNYRHAWDIAGMYLQVGLHLELSRYLWQNFVYFVAAIAFVAAVAACGRSPPKALWVAKSCSSPVLRCWNRELVVDGGLSFSRSRAVVSSAGGQCCPATTNRRICYVPRAAALWAPTCAGFGHLRGSRLDFVASVALVRPLCLAGFAFLPQLFAQPVTSKLLKEIGSIGIRSASGTD